MNSCWDILCNSEIARYAGTSLFCHRCRQCILTLYCVDWCRRYNYYTRGLKRYSLGTYEIPIRNMSFDIQNSWSLNLSHFSWSRLLIHNSITIITRFVLKTNEQEQLSTFAGIWQRQLVKRSCAENAVDIKYHSDIRTLQSGELYRRYMYSERGPDFLYIGQGAFWWLHIIHDAICVSAQITKT